MFDPGRSTNTAFLMYRTQHYMSAPCRSCALILSSCTRRKQVLKGGRIHESSKRYQLRRFLFVFLRLLPNVGLCAHQFYLKRTNGRARPATDVSVSYRPSHRGREIWGARDDGDLKAERRPSGLLNLCFLRVTGDVWTAPPIIVFRALVSVCPCAEPCERPTWRSSSLQFENLGNVSLSSSPSELTIFHGIDVARWKFKPRFLFFGPCACMQVMLYCVILRQVMLGYVISCRTVLYEIALYSVVRYCVKLCHRAVRYVILCHVTFY